MTSLCVIQAVDFDEEFNVLRYSIEEDHNGICIAMIMLGIIWQASMHRDDWYLPYPFKSYEIMVKILSSVSSLSQPSPYPSLIPS